MIKLAASDLDGTILVNGAQSVDKSLIEVISGLLNKGILFAPASGRQVESLKMLFAPVAEELLYIAENGALVKYKGETISKTAMDYELAMSIAEDVYKIPTCELLVSGEKYAYISPKSEEYRIRMTREVKYKIKFVDDFRQIDEDILKVAVCDLSGIENSKDYLISTWGDKAAATVSGALYLDYMDSHVSKGNAMLKVMSHFGLKPDECMAFGDNYNDCEMLDAVGHSYVMNTAVDDVKKHGKYITDSVERELEKLLSNA